MSDRLAELRRQRALVQEHLAWLDREIAAVDPKTPNPEPQTALLAATRAPRLQTPNPKLQTASAAAPADDALLDQYRMEPTALRADVRKGCFLYFTAALVLLVVIVGILYVALTAR